MRWRIRRDPTVTVGAIDEAITNNPGPASECAQEITKFREATKDLLDVLANRKAFVASPGVAADLTVARANVKMKAFFKAREHCIRCLGVQPLKYECHSKQGRGSDHFSFPTSQEGYEA
jgi:hypothetical protein